MNFSEEEKNAVVWSMLALAECDGSKTIDELKKITKFSKSIGFDPATSLKIVNNLQEVDVFATLRSCSSEKKAFIKENLEELAAVDGEINHLEKNALSNITLWGKF